MGIRPRAMDNQPDTNNPTSLLLDLANRLDDLIARVEQMEATIRANDHVLHRPEIPAPVGQFTLHQFISTEKSEDRDDLPLL